MQNQQLCSYKYCYYNIAKKLSQSEKEMIQQIPCPLCIEAVYCSQRCRDLDLNNHKQNCIPTTPSRTTENSELNDSASTLKSIRRSQEDFEIVNKDRSNADLGKGSYGSVKLVRDRQSGTLFAMKIMNKKQIFEYCSVENLKREIKIQRKLTHPHVTKLFHYFEDKENVYLILEYAENGSLFNYLRKRRKLPENEAFVYFYQTCLGIDYLHKKQIIHRDLKPENLLLDKQGNIKLCDFGWSAETAGDNSKRKTFCGTIDYMAPEMLQNLSHDFTLDIWCLGILLFELVHGSAPYKGKNDTEKCQNIVQNTPIIYDPTLTNDLKCLIRDILRYQSYQRLSMKQIFEHPWMKTQAKVYSIDIQSYVYKETIEPSNVRLKSEVQSISPSNQLPQSRQIQSQKSEQPLYQSVQHGGKYEQEKQKNMLSKTQIYQSQPQTQNNYGQLNNTYGEEDSYKTRVSRISQKNYQAQEMREVAKNNRDDPKFMDRVFMALGCLNRDKSTLQQK